ncbi:uncharacterized protein [Physcomitrium patens]|uniref:uncharacterized protein isoform X1 n=1 Tax=Physcomitrium patens TaxID=3218 RepID=UPI003CCE0359
MACEQRASTNPPTRSRWSANQQQLQNLESIFEQGNGNTPNKARIKDITIELNQFGHISETNVYNWFQNRKARAKRKLQQRVGRTRRLSCTATGSTCKWRVNQMRSGEAEISGDVQPYLPDAKRLKAVGPQSQSATGSAATPASALDAGSSIAAAEIDTELRSRPALMPLTSITPLTMPLTVTRVEAIEETLGGGAEHWHDQEVEDYSIWQGFLNNQYVLL